MVCDGGAALSLPHLLYKVFTTPSGQTWELQQALIEAHWGRNHLNLKDLYKMSECKCLQCVYDVQKHVYSKIYCKDWVMIMEWIMYVHYKCVRTTVTSFPNAKAEKKKKSVVCWKLATLVNDHRNFNELRNVRWITACCRLPTDYYRFFSHSVMRNILFNSLFLLKSLYCKCHPAPKKNLCSCATGA